MVTNFLYHIIVFIFVNSLLNSCQNEYSFETKQTCSLHHSSKFSQYIILLGLKQYKMYSP